MRCCAVGIHTHRRWHSDKVYWFLFSLAETGQAGVKYNFWILHKVFRSSIFVHFFFGQPTTKKLTRWTNWVYALCPWTLTGGRLIQLFLLFTVSVAVFVSVYVRACCVCCWPWPVSHIQKPITTGAYAWIACRLPSIQRSICAPFGP